eukprot:89105-Prorocentrum_lima.AAC.1
MVVAEAAEQSVTKAGCLAEMPSTTPQFLGLLVDVAGDQLVHELYRAHELGLVHGNGPAHELDL